jgi:hypothetical protein
MAGGALVVWELQGGDGELHGGHVICVCWTNFIDLGLVNSARKHCIDLGRCRRCRRLRTSLPSLEASPRSSFTSLVASSLGLSG